MNNGLTKVYRKDGSHMMVNDRTLIAKDRLNLSLKNPKAKKKDKTED